MPIDPMRPECRLVTRCARTRMDSARREEIDDLLTQPLDWNYFRRAAVNHGVGALCYAQLRAACAEQVPGEQMEWLREHAKAVAGRNLNLSAKLAALVRGLRSRGITAIPYKGPVLAVMAYGNLALREFADLDLVLSERELPQAWELLEAEGYAPEQAAAPTRGSNEAPGQYAFLSPGGDFLVELHTERTLRHFPRALAPDRLARSLAPVVVNGEPISTFSPEECLIFLSVHGAKDFWARLLWVADVAELVQIPQGFDWPKALVAAHELGCGRLVRLGLLLAGTLLEAPIPAEVLAQARGDRGAQALAREVTRRLFAGQSTGAYEQLHFRMRMVEGVWPGARYAWRLATAPTAEDREAVRLPPGLGFLYRIIRPLRLLGRQGKR
jgi:Uncharacterised nucleotidyltransferase